MGWLNESLFKWSRSHDQDGRHAYTWWKTLKSFSLELSDRWPWNLVCSIGYASTTKICSNDGPGLTLIYFIARSNSVPYTYVLGKGKTMVSETIVVCDIKVGSCRQLHKYINLCECQRPRSFIDISPRSLRFNIFKLFSLEIARPIEVKFHVKPGLTLTFLQQGQI